MTQLSFEKMFFFLVLFFGMERKDRQVASDAGLCGKKTENRQKTGKLKTKEKQTQITYKSTLGGTENSGKEKKP
jgi:hypothetical protein